MAKFVDSDGIQRFKDKILALIPTKYAGSPTAGGIANKTMAIPHGKIDTGSTSTVMTATVDGITELKDGVCAMITNGVVTSASGWTLNVNSLGAKPVYNTMGASSRITTTYNSAYTMLFVYNETRVSGGCWDMYYGYNAGYTNNVQQGQGYATCTTAEATKAKVATLSSYALVAQGIVSVHFTHAVPAGSTLNVNSKGAKAIYYRGSAITDGIIQAGDTATFIYSSHYNLIAIDRANPTKTSELTNDSGYITSASVPTKVSELTNDAGYTANTGTITGITMNGISQGTSGVVNLGTVITDVSDKASKTKVGEVAIVSSGSRYEITSLTQDTVSNISCLQVWLDDGSVDGTPINLPDLAGFATGVQGIMSDVASTYATQSSVNGKADKDKVGEITINDTEWDITNYEKVTLNNISGVRMTCVNTASTPQALMNIFLPDIDGVTTASQMIISQIPTATSDLTNDSGFITSADVPTATSQLTNDSGFITASAISGIVGLETFTNWTSGSHDANDAPIGLVRVVGYTNNVTNLPWNIVGAYGFLLTIGGAQKIQIAARTNASGIHSVYMRHYNGTDWYPWATIYDSTAVYTNANEVSY